MFLVAGTLVMGVVLHGTSFEGEYIYRVGGVRFVGRYDKNSSQVRDIKMPLQRSRANGGGRGIWGRVNERGGNDSTLKRRIVQHERVHRGFTEKAKSVQRGDSGRNRDAARWFRSRSHDVHRPIISLSFFFFSLSFFFTDGGALLKRTAHFLSILL